MSTTYKTLQLYTHEYRKHPWLFLGALMMGPGFVLQNIISPLFIAKILGQLSEHSAVSQNYMYYAAASLFSGALLTYVGDRYFAMKLTNTIIHNLYRLCLDTILKQDYGFFTNSYAGSLVTQANRLAKGYELFTNTTFLEMLGIWCGVITAVTIMIFYNPTLGIIIGLLWLMAIAIVILLVIRRIPLRRHAVNQESRLTGTLADIITNILTIQTFARKTAEEKRYETDNSELSNRYMVSWKRAISNHFILQLICVVLQLIVLVGGIHDVKNGSLTLALFLLFQVYILRIIDSIMKASIEMRQLEGVFGDAAEMTELLSREPEIKDPLQPIVARISKGTVQFNNISFSYDDTANNTTELLANFSLNIAPGEKVGLVGPSGGGKSTLTKLLLRFMDVQSGSITIDGQDIRSISQDSLHAAISYVPQEPLLFHRTIEENISYGRENATQKEIIAAARSAHADNFITQLPDGYQTLVGERGIKLSGGQRQRVVIARAMLKQSPLLILDEATSALDSESEAYIQDSLWKLMEHKTTVVIAHRLSTIQHMDRILVLDDGKIIEQGTHQSLLKSKGMYAKLWQRQSGGFIEA
jgi:ATP-binding cassette subfamily B protein